MPAVDLLMMFIVVVFFFLEVNLRFGSIRWIYQSAPKVENDGPQRDACVCMWMWRDYCIK